MKNHTPTLLRSRRWFTYAAAAIPASALLSVHATQAQSTPESGIEFVGSPHSFVYRNQAHLFGRSSDGMLYHCWRDGNGWRDNEAWTTWSPVNEAHIPINTNVEPFVLQVDDSIVVFWCADNDLIFFRFFDDESGWEIDPKHHVVETYEGFDSAVRAIIWNSNLYVFGTTESGYCGWSKFDLGERRAVWDYIDAEWSATGPPAVNATDESLWVYWTSDSGSIYQTQFNGNTWDRWIPVGR